MEAFLKAVRRRLRLAWAVATGQALAPAAFGVAVVLTGVGRLSPVTWADPAAVIAVGVAAAALVAAAVTRRVPLSVAARAADRGLGTRDALVTALELGPPPPAGSAALGGLATRVHERASSILGGYTAGDAVRLRPSPRRLAVSALLLISALALGILPNPQDEVARRRAAEQALLDEQSRRLAQAAGELGRSATGKAQEAAARELERAASELASASGLDAGQRALDRSAARLAREIDSNLLGMKAAVRGLEKSQSTAPLPGTKGGSASSQLAAAAKALGGLSAQEREALAARLDALAATQQSGDPETARALQSAAGALRSGDLPAAAAALGQAGAAHAATTGDLQDQEAAAAALGTLALAAQALAAGPQTQGQGQGGQGQAQGQGQSQGQGGQGGRGGQGQGGQGQGGQGQGGAGGGTVTGNNATTGSGRGGSGTAAGTGNNATVGVQSATVYDPAKGTNGEQLIVGGRSGGGPGQTVGRGDLSDPAGVPLVPLTQAFPRYRDQASEALSRLDIPPSLRAMIRAYFDSLDAR